MTNRDVRMASSNCLHASGPAPPSQGSLGMRSRAAVFDVGSARPPPFLARCIRS